MAVRGETILTIQAATSDTKIVFCKQYSVDLRKGAGFTGSIIRSFFSSAHQCFNSYGSGIKGLNLPIYEVSEDNDVAIMTQPLDFTA